MHYSLVRAFSLFLLLGVASLSHAAHAFKIQGVKGDLLKNIHARLDSGDKLHSFDVPKRAKVIRQQVQKAMQPFGYYQSQIRISGRRISIKKDLPVRIYQINLRIDGPGRGLYHKIRTPLPIEVGDILNTEQYEKAKQMLFDIAESHGYLQAAFKKTRVLVNLKNHRATLIMQFHTGKRFYFGDIRFSQTSYDTAFLKRFIHFQAHSPYSVEKITRLNENLSQSGYFSSVNVKPHISDNTTVPVDIYLKPRPAKNYTLGFGYGTDTGVRGRAGMQLFHINDQGHTFQALAQGSEKQNSLQAQYMIPGRNPVNTRYMLSANIFTLDYPTGYSDASLLSLAYIHHQDDKQYNLSINALHERFRYTDENKQSATMLYPKAEVTFRKVSNPLFPKSGYKVSLALQAASRSAASTENFVQATLWLRAAFWLPTHSRIYLRAGLGETLTEQVRNLPLSLQLLAGGADSIRGYGFQSIGPGKREVIGTAEVQQEIIEDWFLTGFYDIGDVYKPQARAFKRGVGGGLMWASPVGPVRVSFARALDGLGQPYKIIISMGPDL